MKFCIVILLLVSLGFSPEAEEAPSFRNDVIPALTKLSCNSGSCHGSQYGKGGFKLSLRGFDVDSDYEAVVKDLKGRRVNLFEPAQSLILRKPSLAIPHGGGQRFPVGSQVYNLILGWIAAGVPGPRPDDVHLTAVEISSSSYAMQPNQKQQVQVSARYSDKSTRDVTALSQFEIMNGAVAEVTQEGLISAKGSGWAPVVARYMGTARVVNVLVPHAKIGSVAGFAPNNFIDELVQAKWKEVGLGPTGLAGDAQFLRRVHLDLNGTLPNEEEILEFLADTSKDKRAKVIDRLLERPAYADFWALKWNELLWSRMGGKAGWNFQHWLKDNLRKNRPVDQMVRDILLARGEPEKNDVAAFYRLAVSETEGFKPEELAEEVARTFMGVRLGCAKCHQHPFEKWSQADYYGMAAFFARVDFKPNSARSFKSFSMLRLKPTGFVRHPKTKQVVYPTTPDGLAAGYDGDPRIQLAEWLTSAKNPWFATSFVNRYWGYLMGRGLVEPLDDLRETNPASNPELLAALAMKFVDTGFDQKQMLRKIVNSRVYQLDSEPPPGSPQDNTFYTFYQVKRLSAEQLLEAINFGTGAPEKLGGFPGGYHPIQLPAMVSSNFLDLFGRSSLQAPGSNLNVSQVLRLMNSDYLEEKISSASGRVRTLLQLVPIAQIVPNLFYATLSRAPTTEEYRKAMEILSQNESREGKGKALEDLLWSLLNSKEFLFNH